MAARLQLFGSPTVEHGGDSAALPFERRTQLAAFLALRRSWVGRTELAAMLWPEQGAKLAYSNLRKTLFRLQAVPWASGIEVQGGALRFEPATDVLEFEAALREGRAADALPLRRGELLAGFDDGQSEAWTSWLGFERERLAAAWRGAALARLDAEIGAAEGVALSARLLEADPLDEAAVRAHMTWLSRSGQGAQARQAYRDFVQRLQHDLGLAPGAGLQALHDSLAADSVATLAVAPAAAAAADSDFVGRGLELRRIAELLAHDDCRLLSLVGPGGVGKTRLARRALEQLAPGFPDGATFVALEDTAAAGEIGARIARELGIARTGRGDPLEQVVEHLRTRQALLVLDNFEHLVAGAPLVAGMLRDCARLKVVVTSRVRLALAPERLLPLEGLPCPEPEDHDRLEAFDAVRLFVRAARRVQPALEPEAEAIADICRQVEGLPLALELAGAWTRVLSCAAIAAELRQGTELLHAVDGAHPPRHASFEVVFDQSWRLLGTVERDALARLSVFRGGFSVEGARAVAGTSLPVLGALVDKSLLRKDGERIFLHPLVHHLAGLRLAAGEPRESTQRAHALHFHRLLAQLRRPVEDGDREALARVDAEFENVRIAWRWAAATAAAADALAKSAPTLLHFCDHRGRQEEGLALLREALAAPEGARAPGLEALLLGAAAHLEYRLDRYADAESTATRALAGTREGEDHATRLQCLKVLGGCCFRLARLDDARRYFRQALKQAPASVDPHNAAAMLDNLALVEKASGRYDEALRLSLESLTQHRRLDDVAGVSLCLNNLGSFHLERRDFAAAVPYLREGLAICERHGHVSTRGLVLANLTEIAMKTGELDEAQSLGARALEVAHASGNRHLTAFLRLQIALIAVRRGDLPRARSGLAESLQAAIAIGRPSLLLAGACGFAEVLAAQGEAECARRVLAFAADHPAMGATDRDEVRERLAQAGTGALPAWPGIELAELAHRIVVENKVAHAPLIAALGGTAR